MTAEAKSYLKSLLHSYGHQYFKIAHTEKQDYSVADDKFIPLMESYAKTQAIEFAEWIGTRGYINRESNPNQWIQQMDTLAEEQFTTEQLHQKWEEQK